MTFGARRELEAAEINFGGTINPAIYGLDRMRYVDVDDAWRSLRGKLR
jgi:hypothetical protein